MSVEIPELIYGTAWKEEKTEALVDQAIKCGYRAIDTANQRKHYFEAAVGASLAKAFSSGIKREDLFLQTKYTFQRGQDHRLPYDPNDSISDQVEQSFKSSLKNLGLKTIDSYLLHGPMYGKGIVDEDKEAWRAIEALNESGGAKYIGLSNVSAEQLSLFYKFAKIKPKFVQNRCYAHLGWDLDVRGFCAEKGIRYQGFSLLTANRHVLEALADFAKQSDFSSAQILFRFAQQIGIIPLTGTTSELHMKHDISLDFDLDQSMLINIENIYRMKQ